MQFNETNTQLITSTIFGTTEVLNQIDEVQDHYKILKCFLPNFNEYYAYRYFNPFPYFNCNFRIKGQGKTIKIVPNKLLAKRKGLKTYLMENLLEKVYLIFSH